MKHPVKFSRGVYPSYHWLGDQDPIIDLMLDLKDKVGMSNAELERRSHVTSGTFNNWWTKRKTRRPSFSSATAVVRAMGGKILIQHGETTIKLESYLNGTGRHKKRRQ